VLKALHGVWDENQDAYDYEQSLSGLCSYIYNAIVHDIVKINTQFYHNTLFVDQPASFLLTLQHLPATFDSSTLPL
jgi:hypothetical protein